MTTDESLQLPVSSEKWEEYLPSHLAIAKRLEEIMSSMSLEQIRCLANVIFFSLPRMVPNRIRPLHPSCRSHSTTTDFCFQMKTTCHYNGHNTLTDWLNTSIIKGQRKSPKVLLHEYNIQSTLDFMRKLLTWINISCIFKAHICWVKYIRITFFFSKMCTQY